MKTRLLLITPLLMCMSAVAQEVEMVIYQDCSRNGAAINLSASGSAAVQNNPRTSCEYVQLWENGPRWAAFNVGATITDYADLTIGADATPFYNYQDQAQYYNTANVGGLYAWNQPSNNGRQTTWTADDISKKGISDVATYLWGSNWKTPTYDDLNNLQSNSYTTWTWCNGASTQYVPGCKLKGYKVSGIGAYAEQSIFLPAAGFYATFDGMIYDASNYGFYWSNLDYGSYYARYLYLYSGAYDMDYYSHFLGRSVRAVLVEGNPTYTLTVYNKDCESPNTLTCFAGTQVTLTAEDKMDGVAFERWSDGDTANPRTLTIHDNLTLTAEYVTSKITYPITVGGLTVTSDNSDDVLGDGGSVVYNADGGTIYIHKDVTIDGGAGNGITFDGQCYITLLADCNIQAKGYGIEATKGLTIQTTKEDSHTINIESDKEAIKSAGGDCLLLNASVSAVSALASAIDVSENDLAVINSNLYMANKSYSEAVCKGVNLLYTRDCYIETKGVSFSAEKKGLIDDATGLLTTKPVTIKKGTKPTDLNNVNDNVNITKRLINGQLVIIREGKTYNMVGAKL